MVMKRDKFLCFRVFFAFGIDRAQKTIVVYFRTEKLTNKNVLVT